MSSDDIAIRVCNLSKSYQIYEAPRDRLKQFILPRLQRVAGQAPKQYYREFRALNDVSFEVRKGETVGIIGRNGSGKSTLLQIICGTLSPTGGTVETRGRIAALLELGSGFNPEFTGRENVYMNASVLGLGQDETNRRFNEIAAFADIGQFIDQPVKTYSSGMVVRLAFAVSVCVEPDIMVVDEALAVGDMAFQQKCLQRLSDLREMGSTILLVTHDIMLIRKYCSWAIYLERGQVKDSGDPESIGEVYIKDSFASQQQGGGGDIEWRHGLGKHSFGASGGQITNVSLSGNNSPGVFRNSETVIATVVAQVDNRIVNPEIVIQIRDARGYVLYGIRTCSDDLIRIPDSTCFTIEATLDIQADLVAGQYAVTVGLNDRIGDSLVTMLDKAVAAVIFSVTNDKPLIHGCIDLGGRWRNPIEVLGQK